MAAVLGGLASAGGAGAETIYFGNLHAHTAYSDGSGAPADAFAAARAGSMSWL